VHRICWPWKAEALLGLEVKGTQRVRIEHRDVFYCVVDAVMRLPVSERDRVIVWVSLDQQATELRFDDVRQWGERADRPLPRARLQQIAGITLAVA
jgi:hypothetical protein